MSKISNKYYFDIGPYYFVDVFLENLSMILVKSISIAHNQINFNQENFEQVKVEV